LAINVYEGLVIFDTGRYGRDPEGVSGAINRIVEEAGGEVLASRLWDERRLAYPIKGQRKGSYWLTYFRIEGQQLSAINRQFELDDNILRSLALKVDPRIVDALVAHANGVVLEEEAPAETPAEAEKPAETAGAVAELEADAQAKAEPEAEAEAS
jgi:small subunit ribosomal protein S6